MIDLAQFRLSDFVSRDCKTLFYKLINNIFVVYTYKNRVSFVKIFQHALVPLKNFL